jgi:hypothetical protein
MNNILMVVTSGDISWSVWSRLEGYEEVSCMHSHALLGTRGCTSYDEYTVHAVTLGPD